MPEEGDISRFCVDTLLVDSGASCHILNDKKNFTDFTEFDNNQCHEHIIALADGTRTKGMVKGKGTAHVVVHDSEGNHKLIKLQDALYMPTYH